MNNHTPNQNRIKELEIVVTAIKGELDKLNDKEDTITTKKSDIQLYAKMLTETKNTIYKLKTR